MSGNWYDWFPVLWTEQQILELIINADLFAKGLFYLHKHTKRFPQSIFYNLHVDEILKLHYCWAINLLKSLGFHRHLRSSLSQISEIFPFLPLKNEKILRVTFPSFAERAWVTVKHFRSTFPSKAQEIFFNEQYFFILWNCIQQNPKICPSQTVWIYQVTLGLHFQILIYYYST